MFDEIDIKMAFDWIAFSDGLFPEPERKELLNKVAASYPSEFKEWMRFKEWMSENNKYFKECGIYDHYKR
ncbi:hypothetical protein ABEU95_12365 [Heyndrickxia faecalis]|uniref:hypothetical protein n=1 Tax=Heyndrickxia faecalis TaxID=2824910 RepID=UPI003D24EEE9